MDIKNQELISQGEYFTVHRAEIPQLGGWVILKKPCISDWVANLSRLKHEFKIRRTLNLEGVPRVLQLYETPEEHVLISEDSAAQSLMSLIDMGTFSNMSYFLSVAIQLVTVLESIHRQKIIHNNINPQNILVQNDQVFFVGFSLAQHADHLSDNTSIILDQNLSYLSPEQTGRINRKLDYRSDFYSLGICLYQMLTGHVPFEAKDPIELIHQHLAKLPSFSDAGVHASPVVCNIVLKLLDKNPEKRYQSCFGILDDLKKCFQSIADVGYVRHFNIGLSDQLGLIKRVVHMYGRQDSLVALDQVFQDVEHGRNGLALISGLAGIGKTSLLKEFYRQNCHKIGIYAVGACEKAQRKTPFSCLLQVLDKIISQLLALPEDQLQSWKNSVTAELGIFANGIVHLFPSLIRVLDIEPIPFVNYTTESDAVFVNGLLSFISCLSIDENPCVLAFDDMQWIDTASARFIKLLLQRNDIKKVMVICLCREVDNNYRNSTMLELASEFRQALAFVSIVLEGLDRSETRLILHEMLGIDSNYLSSLADLVLKKTAGNPFFIQYFVGLLYENGALSLNEEKNNWVWDAAAILAMEMVGNIDVIMQTRLKLLQPQLRSILNLLVCYGSSFRLDDIVKINGQDEVSVHRDIIALVNIGLVDIIAEIDGQYTYKIFHEKAQQDIYDNIDFDQRCLIHVSIARAFLKDSLDWTVPDTVFFIANHFNSGLPMLEDLTEKYVVARLNVVAGDYSKKAGSYDLSLNFYKRAIGLVGEDHWATHAKFMKSLYVQSIETAYYCHNVDFAASIEKKYDLMVSHFFEQLPIVELKLNYFLVTGKFNESILLGRDTLKKLGLNFERSIPLQQLKNDYLELKLVLESEITNKGISNKNSTLTELEQKIVRVLASQIEPALVLNQSYFCQVVLSATQMVLDVDHPLTGYILAYYALMQAYVFNDCESVRATSEYALKIQTLHDEPQYLPRALNVVNAHLRHFWQPISKSLPGFERSISLAVKSGNVYFAGQGITFSLFAHFFAGQHLASISEFMAHHLPRLSLYKLTASRDAVFPWCQIITNLQNTNEVYLNSAHLKHLKGRYFNDRLMFRVESSENEFMIFSAYTAKAWYAFCLRDIDSALSAICKAEKYCYSMHGMVHFHIFYALAGQIYAAAARRYDHESDYYISKAQIYLDLLENLATQCPDNYLHKLYILKAEIAYFNEEHLAALKYFEKSIRQALNGDFIHDAALAAEQAALYCMDNNISVAARGFLMTALEQYKRWGASVKVFTLSRDYSQILLPFEYSVFTPNLSKTLESKTTPFIRQNAMETNVSNDDPIDYLSAIRVSHLISQELDPQRLLATIIELISINAGADRGVLFQVHGDELKAAASFPKFDHYKLNSSFDTLACMSIVNYVKRLRKPVIVDDAVSDVQYFGDTYVKHHKVRSVLCAPFVYQSRLLGVIYLENNQSSHVFNSERLAFLQLVAKQSAISFENAKYYDAVLSAEEAMQEQKSLLESILNSISEGVVVIDEKKKVIHYNHMAQSLLGIDSSDLQINEWPEHYGLYNMDKKTYFPVDEFPALRALSGDTFSNVKMHVRNNLNQGGRDLLVSGCPLTSIDGNFRRGGVISLRDMSEFNRNLEQIQHLATHDELTNLPNRNLFYDRIAQAVLMAGQYNNVGAVLFLDLDNFKEVNDSLGHSVGDILLQEITKRLENHIKECDTVARLGGDEFGMLLDKLDSFSDASKVAQRIIDNIAQPIIIDGQLIQTSVSIGVTVFPVDGINTEQLLKNADLAMYSAKSQGRNTFCFFADHMNDKVLLKKKLGQELREALELDQFEMYYQPQVNPVTHSLIGFESLIRWPAHPENNAEQFISIAEEIGIIHVIGEWILRQVCLQIQLWAQTELNVPIAVNISALQFRQSSFIPMVRSIIQQTGVSPALLEFELTESAVFHFKDGLSKMQQLKEMGVHISLDDFGTGYSSLSHLKRLPVQKIKIDRSFIHDVDINEDSCNITHAIITLGHCLELSVVAEGVENLDQLQLLRGLQCDIIQGHYFSKPLSAAQALDWYHRFKAEAQRVLS